jgi:hypothetical protein
MSIVFTEANRLQSRASWHDDMDVNREQAAKLAKDAQMTIGRLTGVALKTRLGKVPPLGERRKHLRYAEEPGTEFVWVCWKGEAIAVHTHAKSHIENRRYHLTWYWKTLNERN